MATRGGHEEVALTSASPRLYLHPAHCLPGQQDISAIPSNGLPEEFVSLSVADLHIAFHHQAASADLRGLPLVVIAGRKVSAVCANAGTTVLKLPLPFVRVALAWSLQLGLPVITITPRDMSSCWLVLVAGGAAVVQEVLAGMAESGAIRSDFSDLYAFEPRCLGKGANAVVFAVLEKLEEDTVTGGGLVGKISLRDGQSVRGKKIPKDLGQEVCMLATVQRHPNVIGFCGLFHAEDVEFNGRRGPQWVLLMERCSGGDLVDAVFRSLFTESRARSIMTGLLSALAFVHRRHIVHRDVKPENILLSNGRAVLADFGIACHLGDLREMDRRCGSPSYAAPEIIQGKPYSAKVDAFSSGSLLFFLISAKVPFYGSNITSMMRRTLRCVVDFGISQEFSQLSSHCKDFIRMLLQKCPGQRLSAQEALTHRWITQEFPTDARQRPAVASPGDPEPAAPGSEEEEQLRRSSSSVAESGALAGKAGGLRSGSSSSKTGQRPDRSRPTEDSSEAADESRTAGDASLRLAQGGAASADDRPEAERAKPTLRGYLSGGVSRLLRIRSTKTSSSTFSSEASDDTTSTASESAMTASPRPSNDSHQNAPSRDGSWDSASSAASSKAPRKRPSVKESSSTSSSGLSTSSAKRTSDLTASSSFLETVHEESDTGSLHMSQDMSFSEALMSGEEYEDVEADAVGLRVRHREGSVPSAGSKTAVAGTSQAIPRPPSTRQVACSRRPMGSVRYVAAQSSSDALQT